MKSLLFCLPILLVQLVLTGLYPAQAGDAPHKSIDMLRQRALMGDFEAQRKLGVDILSDHDISNDQEGVDWLRRAAGSGEWFAAYYLGQSYLYGWHSLSDDSSDGAIKWLRLAAQNVPPDVEAGNDVYTLLGRLYSGFNIDGARGYPSVDDVEAVKWYRLCAVNYSTYCQSELGAILIKSPATAAEGYRWLRHAAELANPWAMYDLGELYASGEIVKQDNVQSLAWFK